MTGRENPRKQTGIYPLFYSGLMFLFRPEEYDNQNRHTTWKIATYCSSENRKIIFIELFVVPVRPRLPLYKGIFTVKKNNLFV